ILEDGEIPGVETIDAVGFFAEHKLDYPRPTCGEDLCAHALLGVAGNLLTGANCTLVQIGLNSPLNPAEIARPPLDLVIALDTSGSMRGEPIDYVRRGLTRMLTVLEPEDTVSLVVYADQAVVLIEDGTVTEREALEAAIDRVTARGATNIHDGLFVAFQLADARRAPGREARVMLLSDGVATAGLEQRERLQALAEGYARRGVGLTAVGVGTEFDIDLMRTLGEVGAGNFYFLENPAAVEEVFEEEINTFLVPVALDVEMDLVVGAGYEVRRAYGTQGWRGGLHSGQVRVPSLFLAGRRRASDPVEGGRRGGGGGILVELMPVSDEVDPAQADRVGRLSLRWTDPGTGERLSQVTDITNPHAPGVIPAGGWFTHGTVEKGFVMLNLLVGFQMAASLTEDGDVGSALGVLETLRENVKAWLDGQEDPDADIADDLRYVDLFLANLRRVGATEVRRPPEPWPVD
ncbi:MAG: VWA domain-containing protein, partial [Myxococcales bacterium]|nr:VWA domain-containing protein [Myxococcales bacterium]